MTANENPKWAVLITGGGGYTGRNLAKTLLSYSNVTEIRLLDIRRREFPGSDDPKVKFIIGSLLDKNILTEACRSINVVFHTAVAYGNPKFGCRSIWPPGSEMEVNVAGTELLLDACKKEGVRALIYTSTIRVVYGGMHAFRGAPDDSPAATDQVDWYSYSKAIGEKLVLEADQPGGLRTCALRLDAVYGPGEELTLPRIMHWHNILRKFFIEFPPDDSRKDEPLFNPSFIENIIQACACAAEKLLAEADKVCGEAFLITDEEAVGMNAFFREVCGLEKTSYRIQCRIPRRLLMFLCWFAEMCFYYFYTPVFGWSAPITLSECLHGTTSHYFVGDRARRCLGYKPIPMNQCIKITASAMPQAREQQTKSVLAGPVWLQFRWLLALLFATAAYMLVVFV